MKEVGGTELPAVLALSEVQLLVYMNCWVWLRQLKSAVFSSRLRKLSKPPGLGKYCTVDVFDSLQDLKERETCCFSCVSTLCGLLDCLSR